MDVVSRPAAKMGPREERGERAVNGLLTDAAAPSFGAVETPLQERLFAAGLQLLRGTTAAWAAVLPGGDPLPWRELENKLEAFELFRCARLELGLSAGARPPLLELVRRARALDPYRGLWTLEGLGYAYAENAWSDGQPPAGLLRGGAAADLPRGALLPLHTGIGLWLAERRLARLAAETGAGGAGDALADLLSLCRSHARDGYAEMVFEAVGLVAINLHPRLLPDLDRGLRTLDPELVDYLWHGAGRGLYFSPLHALPVRSAMAWALDRARQEPRGERERRNALAGLAWALTLVNIRRPQILAGVLQHLGGAIWNEEAFAGGVAAAVLVWREAVGEGPTLAALLAHRPPPAAADRWRRLVEASCRAALEQTYGELERHGCWGLLFRDRPFRDAREEP